MTDQQWKDEVFMAWRTNDHKRTQELRAMVEPPPPTPWPGSNPNKASEEFISPAEKEKFLKEKAASQHCCDKEMVLYYVGCWFFKCEVCGKSSETMDKNPIKAAENENQN